MRDPQFFTEEEQQASEPTAREERLLEALAAAEAEAKQATEALAKIIRAAEPLTVREVTLPGGHNVYVSFGHVCALRKAIDAARGGEG